MKTVQHLLVAIALGVALTSCTTISYIPKVSLDVSPKTINSTVQVDKFTDLSPEADRNNPFMGLSVTNPEAMSSNLDVEVANAVASDFATSGLFKYASRRVDNADFVIKGEIKRFYGKSQPNTFGYISTAVGMVSLVVAPAANQPLILLGTAPIFAWYFGVPIQKNTAEVEITLKVYDKGNNLVGTYTGRAVEKTSMSLYKNATMATPTLTNTVFSRVMQQIREQIIADSNKFETN